MAICFTACNEVQLRSKFTVQPNTLLQEEMYSLIYSVFVVHRNLQSSQTRHDIGSHAQIKLAVETVMLSFAQTRQTIREDHFNCSALKVIKV